MPEKIVFDTHDATLLHCPHAGNMTVLQGSHEVLAAREMLSLR